MNTSWPEKWGTTAQSITSIIVLITLVAVGFGYFEPTSRAASEHAAIRQYQLRHYYDLELELLDLNIRFFGNIRERRELTPDEQDDLQYAKSTRDSIRATRQAMD